MYVCVYHVCTGYSWRPEECLWFPSVDKTPNGYFSITWHRIQGTFNTIYNYTQDVVSNPSPFSEDFPETQWAWVLSWFLGKWYMIKLSLEKTNFSGHFSSWIRHVEWLRWKIIVYSDGDLTAETKTRNTRYQKCFHVISREVHIFNNILMTITGVQKCFPKIRTFEFRILEENKCMGFYLGFSSSQYTTSINQFILVGLRESHQDPL